MSSALVLFSGGQDSTTCLYWAKKNFQEVFAIAFDYGQRHKAELEAAMSIAAEALTDLRIFKIDLLNQLTENALTRSDMEIEEVKPDHRPPNTLVEGRNMLFLTYAAVYAKSKRIADIVTGVGQADYSGYPDCRNEFILSLNQTLNLSMEYNYRIHTPLMWKDKGEIWKLSDELGIFDLVRIKTVTCYHGIPGEGCGKCPSCNLRSRGLAQYLKLKKDGQL
jgi:7-cyano-7-deazaguanine synthase